MPIDQKQRDKNTHNKLKKVIEDAPSKITRNPTTQQGMLGREAERSAKNLHMDKGSGSHDYSGSQQEHNRHHAVVTTVKNEAVTGQKRRAIANLARMGYSDIHDRLARKPPIHKD